MSAVTTYLGACTRAAVYRFNSNLGNGFWLALGKTTPWPNDQLPPAPARSLTRLPEVYSFHWIDQCVSVFPDEAGQISTFEGNYRQTNTYDPLVLAASKANYIYNSAFIPSGALIGGLTFRMAGICTNVEFFTPVEKVQGAVVLAAQVKSYDLDWVASFAPITSDSLININYQILREF